MKCSRRCLCVKLCLPRLSKKRLGSFHNLIFLTGISVSITFCLLLPNDSLEGNFYDDFQKVDKKESVGSIMPIDDEEVKETKKLSAHQRNMLALKSRLQMIKLRKEAKKNNYGAVPAQNSLSHKDGEMQKEEMEIVEKAHDIKKGVSEVEELKNGTKLSHESINEISPRREALPLEAMERMKNDTLKSIELLNEKQPMHPKVRDQVNSDSNSSKDFFQNKSFDKKQNVSDQNVNNALGKPSGLNKIVLGIVDETNMHAENLSVKEKSVNSISGDLFEKQKREEKILHEHSLIINKSVTDNGEAHDNSNLSKEKINDKITDDIKIRNALEVDESRQRESLNYTLERNIDETNLPENPAA